jgi:hypothetical protein
MDGLFLSIAQRCGGIEPLLEEFFSFLHRRTDFYVVDSDPRRPMGFGPGDAERMVRAGEACSLLAAVDVVLRPYVCTC